LVHPAFAVPVKGLCAPFACPATYRLIFNVRNPNRVVWLLFAGSAPLLPAHPATDSGTVAAAQPSWPPPRQSAEQAAAVLQQARECMSGRGLLPLLQHPASADTSEHIILYYIRVVGPGSAPWPPDHCPRNLNDEHEAAQLRIDEQRAAANGVHNAYRGTTGLTSKELQAVLQGGSCKRFAAHNRCTAAAVQAGGQHEKIVYSRLAALLRAAGKGARLQFVVPGVASLAEIGCPVLNEQNARMGAEGCGMDSPHLVNVSRHPAPAKCHMFYCTTGK